MLPVQLRLACDTETMLLTRISTDAFHADHLLDGAPEEGPSGYDSITWHKTMQKEGRLYAYQHENGAIIGGAVLLPDAERVMISRVFIDPAYHRQGYGYQLMLAIEKAFPQAVSYRLDTPLANVRTNALYRKLGYREIARKDDTITYEKRILVVDQEVRLIPYYPLYEVTLDWYQDLDVCKQVDNIDHPYDLALLKAMYTYLNEHGQCFYMAYCGQLAGDITLRSNGEICLVVCKAYQNRHIGRRCTEALLHLAKAQGMPCVKANIYAFNRQSQRMFEAVGFQKIADEWYEYRF